MSARRSLSVILTKRVRGEELNPLRAALQAAHAPFVFPDIAHPVGNDPTPAVLQTAAQTIYAKGGNGCGRGIEPRGSLHASVHREHESNVHATLKTEPFCHKLTTLVRKEGLAPPSTAVQTRESAADVLPD